MPACSVAITGSPRSARSARASCRLSCRQGARPRARASASTSRRRPSTRTPSRGVVTRKLARAADDGYRNPLVPGLRATADAERLAVALTAAAERLEPPGPYPVIAESPTSSRRRGSRSCSRSRPGSSRTRSSPRSPRGRTPSPGPAGRAAAARPPPTAPGSERAGSQEAAFTGEEIWTPERRFDRVFERLALPGFTRAARYDLLTALGAAGRYPLEADALHFVEDDATTLAAKRVLVSGDPMLLERRAQDLAEAAGLPIAALDRGLAVWGTPGEHVDLTVEPPGLDPRAGLSLAVTRAGRLAPAASRRRAAGAPPPPTRHRARGRPWRLLLLGCLALARCRCCGVGPTYDPWAWIIWGREVAHLDLVTTTGPSWKPLPVIFTTPFSCRRRRRAAAVAGRRPRRRDPRVRDGLPARHAPGRAGRRA